MKKNLFGLVAAVIAITLFAFTTPRFATVYFVYDPSNPPAEKAIASYDPQTNNPGEQDGDAVQAWFRATVANPNNITLGEFNSAFEAVDGDYGGTDNDLLSDETIEDATQFELRNE
jgi:hypothetical protein